MSPSPAPSAGRSIYRGYASAGLGEGPGRPIARGEQYLAADEPFAGDAALLDALRPWMTLDLDAGDHRLLGDRLEGWSSFTQGDWAIVVRLAPAGVFDRRAAYLAHARAFPVAWLGAAGDPGTLLGRSEAFGRPGAPRLPTPAAAMVRPEQVAAESDVASSLLAHLLQGLHDDRPVVVAVPLEELAAGSPIHALVSFAHLALPVRLRRSCRIRIYSRSPEVFLGRLGSALSVIPESAASDALAVRRDAVLLDRRGSRHAGREPDAAVRNLAQRITLRACERPGALLGFAARYGRRIWDGAEGPPGEREVVSVPIAYRLAEVLAAEEGPVPNLLGQLRNAAAQVEGVGIPWERLLEPEDWRRFPRREVLELVFADPGGLAAGARPLQDAATRAARELRWSVENPVEIGCAPADGGALRRLLDVAAGAPALVPDAVLGRCLERAPLRLLLEFGRLGPVLELEARLGVLDRRAEELAALPGALAEWLRSLEGDEILRLAASLSTAAGELARGMAGALTARMRERPAETTALLIRRAAWSWWRRLARPAPPEARKWALEWLAAPEWEQVPRIDPRLDDWSLAIDDLGERLEEREVVLLLGHGRRGWPWIPLFADRQVADLGGRMPDLGSLAVLVERISADEGRLAREDCAARALGAYAANRPDLGELDPSALLWFMRQPLGAALPDLPLATLQLLHREAGRGRTRLVSNLAARREAGLLSRPAPDLLAWLDALGSPRSGIAPGLPAARQLEDRGRRAGAVGAVDPEPGSRLARTEDARRLVETLAAGRLDDPFWRQLQRELAAHRRAERRGPLHPFRELAAGISGDGAPAPGLSGAWTPFAELMERAPGLFSEDDAGGEEPLPAFELAAVLFEEIPAGSLALRFGFSAPLEMTGRAAWWRALLRGVDGCRRRGGRRSAGDRPEIARALLARALRDLPDPAREALGRALGPGAPSAVRAASSRIDDPCGGRS